MPTAKKTKKVVAEQWYSMQDLLRDNVFPWCHSLFAVRNFVLWDIKNHNMMKTMVTGTGRGTKYNIKGANIIKFIAAVEEGKVQLKN